MMDPEVQGVPARMPNRNSALFESRVLYGNQDSEVQLTENQEAELIAEKLCYHSDDDQKKIQALAQPQSVVGLQRVDKLLDSGTTHLNTVLFKFIAAKPCSHTDDNQMKIQALVQLQSVVNVQGVEKLLD